MDAATLIAVGFAKMTPAERAAHIAAHSPDLSARIDRAERETRLRDMGRDFLGRTAR